MADLPQQFINEASEQFVESSHKFTEPIRLFKSNDPYYFEVDNIPLKQLEENVLFLRDQIANNLSVSGIGREDFAELRPFVTGSDRTVFVNPGRFTARINDCYQKGINVLNELQPVDIAPTTTDPAQRTGIKNIGDRRRTSFTLSSEVLKKLAGEVITGAILDNGLFHFLQHHNSEKLSNNSLRFSFSQDLGVNAGTGISSLPKNKLAVWRSVGENYFQSGNQYNDLQQESVEFTRFWGGAVRTAIVNVPETLSISVPEFNESDYDNQTTFTPTTRVDLLFVFAHPMDASSTSIAKPSGSLPTTITSPQLGLLTGAGVIALNEGTGAFSNFEKGSDPSFFDGATYTDGSASPSNFFKSSNAVNDTTLNYQMISTIGDQNQSDVGVAGRFTNLPSPDDLLNLTPLFEDTLVNNSLARVGQSILPLAYIITRRGSSAIETQDVFDIRPFFRTAELSYNERAGVAAANPPLSFANPAVGKKEFQESLFDVRDSIMTEVNRPILISKPIVNGIVYGGTKWGTEGALLQAYEDVNNTSISNTSDAINVLKDQYCLPDDVTQLPEYPGWDINTDYFASLGSPGEKRNDRLFSAVVNGRGSKFNDNFDNPSFIDLNSEDFEYPTSLLTSDRLNAATYGTVFCKKTFTLSNEIYQSQGYTSFDVKVDLLNCSLMTGMVGGDGSNTNEVLLGCSNMGVFVEKNVKAGTFTVYVALGPASPQGGAPYFGKPSNGPGSLAGGYTQESYMRESNAFSRVLVMSQDQLNREPVVRVNNSGDHDNGGGDNVTGSSFGLGRGATLRSATFFPYWVTYPTVSFTVFGLKGDSPVASIFSTNGQTASNSIL
jgi:hypothetical protein